MRLREENLFSLLPVTTQRHASVAIAVLISLSIDKASPSSESSVIKQEKDVAGKREPCLLLNRSPVVFPYELIAEPVTVRPYHPPTTRGTPAARISDRRAVLARFVHQRRQASSFIRLCFVSGSLGHKLFVFRDRMDQYAFSRGWKRGGEGQFIRYKKFIRGRRIINRISC